MSNIKIDNISRLRGEIIAPADKSISHRAIMISSIAQGKSRIINVLNSLDCVSTADAFKDMGISIAWGSDNTVVIEGRGLRGLKKPERPLYVGNSGTTMRLLLGILAGQEFEATLTGDESLSKRPMRRVIEPLALMGARATGLDNDNLAPIIINGGKLKAIEYSLPVASAQVKSAIMFAGLYANGVTAVKEPYKSRDHTERMLKLFGASIDAEGLSAKVKGMGASQLEPRSLTVPGDISSAAFFIVLGSLVKDSEITISSCGINSTRIGILKVLERMGADIALENIKGDFEPCADILIKSSCLKAARISAQEIPLLIDEVPIISLCATQAQGTTVIDGVGELRVKETDRINSVVTNLKSMGADIEAHKESLIIKGPVRLKGIRAESFGDHRTAMMMVIAGCIAEGETIINDTDCIATSFPGFMNNLRSLAE